MVVRLELRFQVSELLHTGYVQSFGVADICCHSFASVEASTELASINAIYIYDGIDFTLIVLFLHHLRGTSALLGA